MGFYWKFFKKPSLFDNSILTLKAIDDLPIGQIVYYMYLKYKYLSVSVCGCLYIQCLNIICSTYFLL